MASNDKAAVREAQEAAWALLEVNSNLVGGGGSRLFFEGLEVLEKKLLLVEEDTRNEASRLISAMRRKFECKSVGTWRPYVLRILLTLGIPEFRVEKERNKFRLDPQALDKAKEEAKKEDGTMPVLPKRRRMQAPQQPQATLALPAAPSGSAQASAPSVQPSRPAAQPCRRLAAQPSRPPALLALGNGGAPTPPRGIERFFTRSVSRPAPPEPQRPDDEEPPPTQEAPLPDCCKQAAPKAAAEVPPPEAARQEPQQETRQEPQPRQEPQQQPQQSPPQPAGRQGKKRGRWGKAEEQAPRQQRQRRQPQQAQPQQPQPRQTAESPSSSSSSSAPAAGDGDEDGRAQGSADGDEDGGEQGGGDPQCHYAVLGIPKDATLAEISKAYRKKALRTHPDKGGSKELFEVILSAYQVLSDPTKRNQYDDLRGASSAPGNPDEAPQPADEDNDDEGGRDPAELAARAAYAHLLQAKQDWWDYVLGGLSMAVLEHMAAMTTSSTDSLACRRSSKGQEAVAEEEGGDLEQGLSGTGPGIKKKRDGFWIQVGWRSFKVTAYTKPKTLEKALIVHCALTQARATALLRLKAVKSNLNNLQVKVDRSDPLDDCVVLTHAELAAAMAEAPEVVLAFSSDLNKPRVQSPWTTSLDSALHFRVLMRKIRAQGYSGDRLDEATKDLKHLMETEARSNRAARFALSRDLAARIQKEVGRRIEMEEARPPPPAPAPAAPPHPPPPEPKPEMLALKEVAAAAEVERLQKRLEKEEQAHMAALEDLRISNEAWRSTYERAEEQRRREVEEVRRAADEREEQVRRAADEREERARRRLEVVEKRVDEYRDKLDQKCEEVAQAAQAKEEARRCFPNPFRRTPFLQQPTADAMERESTRAAMRESFDRQQQRRARVHVGGTALEPTGSYTLIPPRRLG